MWTQVLVVVYRARMAHRGEANVPVLGHKGHVQLRRGKPVDIPQSRTLIPDFICNGLRHRGNLQALQILAGSARPGAGLRLRDQVAIHLLLDAAHVMLEGLSIALGCFRWHTLVEEHIRLRSFNLFRCDACDLHIIELVPVLRFSLVLAVRDVVATAHRADVLNETNEPVLYRLGRHFLHEGCHVQGGGHRKGNHARILGSIKPAIGVIESEALEVDTQNLRQLLEDHALFAVVLSLAPLTEVLVLAAQVFWSTVPPKAVGQVYAFVVKPAFDLATNRIQNTRPGRAPQPTRPLSLQAG
mmetsp:Transcript_123559/g.293581  ORF Transcript_123559/g.293581 Transcript_123559/m.293581 type:complete len:299 (-) Transcript_123559:92-988(-)